MNKLLIISLCCLIIPIHANILHITSHKNFSSSEEKIINVSFKVTGEGTKNFQPCIYSVCGNPAVVKIPSDIKVQFYIRNTGNISKGFYYKEIHWDSLSCRNMFSICQQQNIGISSTLCYNENISGGNLDITATSTEKDGYLIISNCRIYKSR